MQFLRSTRGSRKKKLRKRQVQRRRIHGDERLENRIDEGNDHALVMKIEQKCDSSLASSGSTSSSTSSTPLTSGSTSSTCSWRNEEEDFDDGEKELAGFDFVDRKICRERVSRRSKNAQRGIFLLKETSSGKLHVLKTVKQPGGAVEARIQKRLVDAGTPNILPLRKYFLTEEAGHCLIVDFCRHGDLQGALQKTLGLPEKDVARYLRNVLQALEGMHALGIAHRDVKPANVMLDDDGKAVLADFGLAAEGVSACGGLSRPAGTPSYMSPEQITGEYGFASDIWGLGVMAFELVVGRPPFFALQRTVLIKKICSHQPFATERLVRRGVSPQMIDFINLCLTRDAASRPSAASLLDHPAIYKP